MTQAPIALLRWQRHAVCASVFALFASGVVWLFVAPPADGDASSAARAAAAWSLRVHGIVAYAMLVVAGSVLTVHVRLGWNRHRNRWSGSLLVALLLLLAGTGLWLYYGPEAGRNVVSVCHWSIGMALPVWLLLHRLWGIGARRR
jgi:uncharacterized membrane protein